MRHFFVILVIFICGVTGGGMWFLKRQTISYRNLETKFTGEQTVKFDDQGIPTLEAPDWPQLIELQGYIVASERLWQMDVMRRQAAGRLSEWFGPASLKSDSDRVLEGWYDAATEAADALAQNQRIFCDAFARGVNRFIEAHPKRWSMEYVLLRVTAEPWECRDSLLILMNMSDTLATTAFREAQQWIWRRNLPKDWENFLFPNTHPWNQPLFKERKAQPAPLPTRQHFLPATPLQASEWAEQPISTPTEIFYGSNSWAWRGPGGYFLANDPHLGYQVPQLWYAMRLRVSANDWVVGVALPGVPGITLGMNPHLAWAFTNVGEDVDDFLLEEINADATQYVAKISAGKKQWRSIEIQQRTIKVKGQKDVVVDVRKTHRGPLLKRANLDERWASRQWLPLKSGMLNMPTIALNQAKTWAEVNASLDQMTVPAQNVIVVDHAGGMGYRASGTSIKRKVSGRWPRAASEGEWLGFEPQSTRRRLWLPARPEYKKREAIATANERIWVDEFGHNWSTEDRKERIQKVLLNLSEGSVEQMQNLQQDDESRFGRELLTWLAAAITDSKISPDINIENWHAWSGSASQDPEAFADALAVEEFLLHVLPRRIAAHYLQAENASPNYYFAMQRAWLLQTLQLEHGLAAFGINKADLAATLLGVIAKSRQQRQPYFVANRWQRQHPFVGRIPIIGNLFKIRDIDQYGHEHLVKVEKPTSGASTRLVWNLQDPRQSSWSFPIGQSGHVGSKFYRNQQRRWLQKRYMPVFTDDFVWNFAGDAANR